MTALGDSLGCSRNPGSNLYAGLSHQANERPRCRRRAASLTPFHSLRVGNAGGRLVRIGIATIAVAVARLMESRQLYLMRPARRLSIGSSTKSCAAGSSNPNQRRSFSPRSISCYLRAPIASYWAAQKLACSWASRTLASLHSTRLKYFASIRLMLGKLCNPAQTLRTDSKALLAGAPSRCPNK